MDRDFTESDDWGFGDSRGFGKLWRLMRGFMRAPSCSGTPTVPKPALFKGSGPSFDVLLGSRLWGGLRTGGYGLFWEFTTFRREFEGLRCMGILGG